MKRILTLAFLIITAFHVKAQEGKIIYVDFEPDTALHVGQQPNTLWIDFDHDELSDLLIYWYFISPGPYLVMKGRDERVCFCVAEEGDTIPHLTEWQTSTSYPHTHEYYGIRIEKDGEYYYGWYRTYDLYEPGVTNDYCFDKYAFCTIPDYPLQWGQTAFTEIGEDLSDGFVSVRPNPTSDVVTVSGENLKQAEVRNVVGQTVAVKKAEGEELFFDFSTQPAGLYFITVTGQNGERCVKKVVKQ